MEGKEICGLEIIILTNWHDQIYIKNGIDKDIRENSYLEWC